MEKEETVIDETINAQLPTTEPILKKQEDEFHSFGRRIIYADYTEDELDAPTIAKILNDSFWIHKDGNHAVSFNVCKLRHQTTFDNIISIDSSWHSVTWVSPDWIVVVVLNVCNVIEEGFVKEPFAILSFFRFNLHAHRQTGNRSSRMNHWVRWKMSPQWAQ